MQDFLTQSSGLSPEERARVLEADDDICRGHDDAAQEGQTAAPPRDESIDYHFIAFVQDSKQCSGQRFRCTHGHQHFGFWIKGKVPKSRLVFCDRAAQVGYTNAGWILVST